MTNPAQRARVAFITDSNTESVFRAGEPVGAGIHVDYFFQKSADAMETGAKNEDSIAWDVDPSGEIVTFVVCDGVGGSYLGHVAARFLAQRLASGFKTWAQTASPEDMFTGEELQRQLDRWRESGQALLEKQPVSTDISPLLAEVLKNRKRDGSHAVFFCGYIDLRPGRNSFFAWMGNVTGQVFDVQGKGLLDLSKMKDDRVRWTTAHGCLGTPQVSWIQTSRIRRVLVTSDGLEEIFGRLSRVYKRSDYAAVVAKLREKSYSDDASMLSLWLPGGEIEPAPEVAAGGEELAKTATAESEPAAIVLGNDHSATQKRSKPPARSTYSLTPAEVAPGPVSDSNPPMQTMDDSRSAATSRSTKREVYLPVWSSKKDNKVRVIGLGSVLLGMLLVFVVAGMLITKQNPMARATVATPIVATATALPQGWFERISRIAKQLQENKPSPTSIEVSPTPEP
ncbi:MAG TPA: protein phosphatase 2C domain-containing protein [Chloroflexia bacterium]|jgi:hypothetical protein